MFRGKRVVHIVAAGRNGEIGKDNGMLWHITEDFKYFREKTLGQVILMGRKTIASLPKPLTRRVVLEVSQKSAFNYTPPFGDYPEKEEALQLMLDVALNRTEMLNTDTIYIAGGGQLYKSTEQYVDTILLTRVEKDFPDADTFYEVPEGFMMEGITQPTINVDLDGELCFVHFVVYQKA